jgi:hypothetical protein
MPKVARKPIPTYRAGHIAKAIAESRPSVDSGLLLADLIEVWGGTKQLALDLKREFDAAGAGGMTRQRILEMIQRLIITNTTQDIGRSAEPSELTDEELQGELLKFIARHGDADPRPA